VTILGGYADPPEWLGGREQVLGTVVRDRLDKNGAAAVELDEELQVVLDRDEGELRAGGRYLILSPRFRQRFWSPGFSRVVHIELHETEPGADDIGSGAWIESHAYYRMLPET
jgi:hypothetical protein